MSQQFPIRSLNSCMWLRHELLRARTLRLGEAGDSGNADEPGDLPEPRLTRQQQRELRNAQARGRGPGKGRGKGRGRKAKEVEDIPPSQDTAEEKSEAGCEDLPGDDDKPKVPKAPRARRAPKAPKTPKAPKAKAEPKAKAKAAKGVSKGKAKAKSRATKPPAEETGASNQSTPQAGKRKHQSKPRGKNQVKAKGFEVKGIPVPERGQLKEFLCHAFGIFVNFKFICL